MVGLEYLAGHFKQLTTIDKYDTYTYIFNLFFVHFTINLNLVDMYTLQGGATLHICTTKFGIDIAANIHF